VHGPVTSGAPVPVLPPQCQGMGMDSEWPLRDFIELGALPGAVPCARLHARQLLWEWGLTRFIDSTELLVSELVTNAMQETRAMEWITPVRLWLLAGKTRVLILVWDASPREPARVNISGDAESGRGLLLVETISDKWDWYFPQDTGGKVVWAEVR
jgi:anti-sigma regulatory factor (Ser/Thr protein kinase)